MVSSSIESRKTLEPQNVDFEAEWIEVRKDFEDTFERTLTRTKYNQNFGRIYKICVATPEPKSKELYEKVADFLEEKADEIAQRLDAFKGETLLEEYGEKWRSYQLATDTINHMCQYLNKNHIDQRRYDNVEVHMVDNHSVDTYLPIKDLAYEKWRFKVIDNIDDKLVTSCLNLIERMRLGETIGSEQKDQVNKAVKSFIDVS